MEWSEIVGSPAAIGLGTGWVAFFALAFMVFRTIKKGEWVPGAVYQRALDVADKSLDANVTVTEALRVEQLAHGETSRQLTEQQRTNEIVRKVFANPVPEVRT